MVVWNFLEIKNGGFLHANSRTINIILRWHNIWKQQPWTNKFQSQDTRYSHLNTATIYILTAKKQYVYAKYVCLIKIIITIRYLKKENTVPVYLLELLGPMTEFGTEGYCSNLNHFRLPLIVLLLMFFLLFDTKPLHFLTVK